MHPWGRVKGKEGEGQRWSVCFLFPRCVEYLDMVEASWHEEKSAQEDAGDLAERLAGSKVSREESRPLYSRSLGLDPPGWRHYKAKQSTK